MAFCANCGSEVQGRFCAKCGTPAAGPVAPGPAAPGPSGGTPYTPPAASYTPPGQTYTQPGPSSYVPPPPAPGAQAAGLEENMACALCYALWVLTGVLFLVLEPYSKNRNVRFHAFQSIFAWLAVIAIGIGIGIIGSIVAFIPFIGWTISVLLWPLYGLGVFVLWLMLMYKAYNRERWVLPVIGPLAEKQALT